jgi:site-specific DNA-adenine methylase
MNQFIFSYNGNKYLEIKKHLLKSELLEYINEYDVIVEPFCGLFGFSRVAYEHGFKGEFYLNDINTDLINSFKSMKNDLNKFIDDIENELSHYTVDSCLSKSKLKSYSLEKTTRGITSNLLSIEKGKAKIKNFKGKIKLYENMLDKCSFFNLNASQFINELPKDKKILIFYDPPYFNSDNKEYQFDFKDGEYHDGTLIYIDILKNMKDLQHHQLFIMNKIEYAGSYYNNSKKIKKHVVYSNY